MIVSHYAKGGNILSHQTSGLRFDIYERVHLPENTIGIRELNGIELTPEISIIEQGEQAILKGHLVLFGTYTGDDDRKTEEQMTHRIPVEITLPLNRIKNVDDIRVEIENFDVDVLSPKVLNVTGVLTLEGIETLSAAEPVWREEEVLFSHRVEEQEPAHTQAPHASALAMEPPSAANPPEAAMPEANTPAENAEAGVSAEAPADANASANAEPVTNEPQEEPAFEAEAVEENASEQAEILAEEPKPEKQEIKIAFAGKPSQENEGKIGVDSIMAIAASGAPPRDQETEVEPAEAPQAEAGGTADGKDRLEWKKRFLQSTSEESFRKVRMCIVQKEDTIETIAERYKKNAREIMLYNRINEEYLQEGQIVYIP